MATTPTRNQLLSQLVNYIALATGLSNGVIARADENAPVPIGGNYCTVVYITDTSIGSHNVTLTEDVDPTQLLYEIRGKRLIRYRVTFYRPEAANLARDLMNFWAMPGGQEFIKDSFFTILNMQEFTDVSQVMSQNFEERSVIEMDLNVPEKRSVLIPKVAKIPISIFTDLGELDGSPLVIEENLEVELPPP